MYPRGYSDFYCSQKYKDTRKWLDKSEVYEMIPLRGLVFQFFNFLCNSFSICFIAGICIANNTLGYILKYSKIERYSGASPFVALVLYSDTITIVN